MISKKLRNKLKDSSYRKAFVGSQINIGIPFQIRGLLRSRGWTQETLARETGMLQPRISALMTPGRVRPNIETLRRVAEAFDCGLIVHFAPFSELARWSEDFNPDKFYVPTFADDVGFIEHKGPNIETAVSAEAQATGTDNTPILRAPVIPFPVPAQGEEAQGEEILPNAASVDSWQQGEVASAANVATMRAAI